MVIIAFWLYMGFIAAVFALGYKWQAMKTPEQRHLEFLIDSNDPEAATYAQKLWGHVPFTVPGYWTDERMALG